MSKPRRLVGIINEINLGITPERSLTYTCTCSYIMYGGMGLSKVPVASHREASRSSNAVGH